LNENSKVIAHINIIPEMNHNEIVGLGSPKELNSKLLIAFLNDPRAYPRNKLRQKVIKDVIGKQIKNIIEVAPEGKDNLQRIFWTVMLGDFISYWLAIKTGIDPMPVKRIDYLKKRLAEYKT
jgi:glucose/mannose-6-phosphate isomerase